MSDYIKYTTLVPDGEKGTPTSKRYLLRSFHHINALGTHSAKVEIDYQRAVSHPVADTYYHSIYISLTFDSRDKYGESCGAGNKEMYMEMFAEHNELQTILNIERWHLWDLNTGAMHHLANGWYWYNMAFNEYYEWYKPEEGEKNLAIWLNCYNWDIDHDFTGMNRDEIEKFFRQRFSHNEWGFMHQPTFNKSAIARWNFLQPILIQDICNLVGGEHNLKVELAWINKYIPYHLLHKED